MWIDIRSYDFGDGETVGREVRVELLSHVLEDEDFPLSWPHCLSLSPAAHQTHPAGFDALVVHEDAQAESGARWDLADHIAVPAFFEEVCRAYEVLVLGEKAPVGVLAVVEEEGGEELLSRQVLREQLSDLGLPFRRGSPVGVAEDQWLLGQLSAHHQHMPPAGELGNVHEAILELLDAARVLESVTSFLGAFSQQEADGLRSGVVLRKGESEVCLVLLLDLQFEEERGAWWFQFLEVVVELTVLVADVDAVEVEQELLEGEGELLAVDLG